MYWMKAHQNFITWLLTVPRGRIFLYISSKFRVNNKLRITNKTPTTFCKREEVDRLVEKTRDV